jgi:hypothetical protein
MLNMPFIPFKPGQSGNPKGRPKGVVINRRNMAYDTLKKLGFDPFAKLVEIALTAKSEFVRFSATSELASYLAPKMRSIEIKSDAESPVVFAFNLGNGETSANFQMGNPEKIIENR